MTTYKPLVISHRMSDYGYWIVDISASPGMVMSVMIAKTGITPDEARTLALGAHASLPGVTSP
jgi:hypothetical protein